MDVDGDTVVVGDREVTFAGPVADTLRAGDVVVVLLDPRDPSVPAYNVFGLSAEGDRLWRIDDANGEIPGGEALVRLYERDGDVWVRNYSSYAFRIDPRTGEILERKPAK